MPQLTFSEKESLQHRCSPSKIFSGDILYERSLKPWQQQYNVMVAKKIDCDMVKPFSCFLFYGLYVLGSPYCVHLSVITMFYWPSSNNEASSIEQDACNGQSMGLYAPWGHNLQVWLRMDRQCSSGDLGNRLRINFLPVNCPCPLVPSFFIDHKT